MSSVLFSARAETALTADLPPDERVLARGRFDVGDLYARYRGGHSFVVVTRERLRYGGWVAPGSNIEEIALDTLTGYADGMELHRYLICLEHAPVERRRRRRRFFREREVAVPETRTFLGFSRAGTEAARALRALLAERGVPRTGSIAVATPWRAARTAGSHRVLRAYHRRGFRERRSRRTAGRRRQVSGAPPRR